MQPDNHSIEFTNSAAQNNRANFLWGVAAAAAVFRTKYQLPFILFAVAANIFGILLMLSILHGQQFSNSKPLFRRLLALDFWRMRIAFVVLAVAIGAASFLFTATKAAAGESPKQSQTFDLQELVDDRNAVNIRLTPEAFRFGEPLRFQVRFDTHQGKPGLSPHYGLPDRAGTGELGLSYR